MTEEALLAPAFNSQFWPWFIAVVTIVSLVACGLFLSWVGRGKRPQEGETSGHVWDGDLVELNNPLPGWWRWLFWVTLAWGAVYLWLYPGLAIFPGSKGWTQEKQYGREMAGAKELYGPLYARFDALPFDQLARDPEALAVGHRLYLNHCTACHGSDAGGAPGYPNLRDEEWQWGGTPEAIETTITYGRFGLMAPWEHALGAQGVDEATQYVLSLTGRASRPELVAAGQAHFERICQTCHGIGGVGNIATGAPPLTDDIWRYGSAESTIRSTIAHGRKGQMPTHDGFLDPAKIRLLTAYVYSLSYPGEAAAGAAPNAAQPTSDDALDATEATAPVDAEPATVSESISGTASDTVPDTTGAQ